MDTARAGGANLPRVVTEVRAGGRGPAPARTGPSPGPSTALSANTSTLTGALS
jgi:hypothetical protein